MKHITNLREARQMQSIGAEMCQVVSITLGDLERIAEVAEANLRDKFAISAMNGLLSFNATKHDDIPVIAYKIADQLLKARNDIPRS